MTTVQITSDVDLEQMIQGMQALDNAELEQVLHRLSVLLARRKAGRLSVAETRLLRKINQSGLGERDQIRYDQLRELLLDEKITADQHAELLKLSEQSEQADADRLMALAELSHLRSISVDQLIQQLGMTASMPNG